MYNFSQQNFENFHYPSGENVQGGSWQNQPFIYPGQTSQAQTFNDNFDFLSYPPPHTHVGGDNTTNDNQAQMLTAPGVNVSYLNAAQIADIVTQVVTNLHSKNVSISEKTIDRNLVETVKSLEGLNKNVSILEATHKLPVFDNSGNLHPVDFIEQLEDFYDLQNVSFDRFKKYVLINHFQGTALLWFQACMLTFDNFKNFKDGFINHFWSENIQDEVKSKLKESTFLEHQGSVVEHFMRLIATARHLQPEMSERALIKKVASNFPAHLYSVLVHSNTLSEALDILRQHDYYNARKQKVSVPKQLSSSGNLRDKAVFDKTYNSHSGSKANSSAFSGPFKKNISTINISEHEESGNEETAPNH